jgi:FlaG/FlaF family flagellin (archaellin)
MLIAIAAVLVGVFYAATGRGGEMSYEHVDHAPLDLGPVSAADVALLRPPTALWGYNMQVTDEALERIAQAIRDRDVTIAFLQQRLADVTAQTTETAPATQTASAYQPADPPASAFQAADQPASAFQAADQPGPEEQPR